MKLEIHVLIMSVMNLLIYEMLDLIYHMVMVAVIICNRRIIV